MGRCLSDSWFLFSPPVEIYAMITYGTPDEMRVWDTVNERDGAAGSAKFYCIEERSERRMVPEKKNGMLVQSYGIFTGFSRDFLWNFRKKKRKVVGKERRKKEPHRHTNEEGKTHSPQAFRMQKMQWRSVEANWIGWNEPQASARLHRVPTFASCQGHTQIVSVFIQASCLPSAAESMEVVLRTVEVEVEVFDLAIVDWLFHSMLSLIILHGFLRYHVRNGWVFWQFDCI